MPDLLLVYSSTGEVSDGWNGWDDRMLKVLLGLVCFYIFFVGNGFYSLIFDFNMNLGNYYQDKLHRFLALMSGLGPVPEGRIYGELITIEVFQKINPFFPHNVMLMFFLRQIAQIVLWTLPLGVWFVISRYKSKNKPLV